MEDHNNGTTEENSPPIRPRYTLERMLDRILRRNHEDLFPILRPLRVEQKPIGDVTMHTHFKRTFSRPVRVHFVGAWYGSTMAFRALADLCLGILSLLSAS